MKIEIIGGSYQDKYSDFNSQRLINWYPVLTPREEKKRDSIAAYPTPGLSTFADCSSSVGGGAIYTVQDLTLSPRCFYINNRILYEVFADGTLTTRGSLLSFHAGSKQPIYMKTDSDSHLTIVQAGIGYVYNLSTNTLTKITDVDFPGADTLEYVDGYFLVTPTDSLKGRVVYSDLNDPTAWTGASVFTPTADSDPVLRIISWREELYLFGTRSIEVYYNDGSPFTRRKGATHSYGLVAKHSAALCHVGIFFVGQSGKGKYAVYQYQSDYTLKPISAAAISWRLGKLQHVEDIVGYIQYSATGDIFYCIDIPEAKTTLVYNVINNMWHERQSKTPYVNSDGTPIYDMYRGCSTTNFNGMNLFVDRYSGKILKEDYGIYTEAGESIERTLTSPVYVQEERFISAHSLEIITNDGNGPGTLQISYSTNAGNTFFPPRIISLGDGSVYGQRRKLNKLGRGKRWVIQIKTSSDADIMLASAIVTGELGGR